MEARAESEVEVTIYVTMKTPTLAYVTERPHWISVVFGARTEEYEAHGIPDSTGAVEWCRNGPLGQLVRVSVAAQHALEARRLTKERWLAVVEGRVLQ